MAPHLPRGFSVSSSSSNEELVDSIIAQAMDQVALEQIAALNTAHLDEDSILPDQLESRFRKLKSFLGATAPEPRARSLPAGKDHTAATEPRAGSPPGQVEKMSVPERAPDRPGNDQALSPKPRSVPPLESGPEGVGDNGAPAAAPDSRTSKHVPFLQSPPPASASRSRGSSHSPRLHYRSPSPPRGCCFGISPKSKQKSCSGRRSVSRGTRTAPRDLNSVTEGVDWDLMDDDALLTELELGTLSIKEQGKQMKRALREQEKATREAEKIVEWVRQASARLEYSAAAAAVGMDELLSDEEKENRM